MNPWEMNWSGGDQQAAAPGQAPWEMNWGATQAARPGHDRYAAARDRFVAAMNQPRKGYVGTLDEMLGEGSAQAGRGFRQLWSGVADHAASGAGRDVVPDSPSARVASGFSPLDPKAPQAPMTESEHRDFNREGIAKITKGFGNVVEGTLNAAASPINAALRTYVGEPMEQATGAPKELWELGAGFALPTAVSRAVSTVGRMISRKPSTEQIKDAARKGFESPAVKGLEVQPAPVTAWSQTLRGDLTGAGLGDVVAGKTWATLAKLDNAPAGAKVTGNDFHALRQQLQTIAIEVDATTRRPTPDAAAATRAIEQLDKFIARGINPRDVIAGDPAAAARVWKEARGNWAAAARADKVDLTQIRAELRAAASNSGQNLDNALRQRVVDILADPGRQRGFAQSELRLMQRLVEGTGTRNTLRNTSNMLGGGGGLGRTLVTAAGAGGGGVVGGGVGAAVGAVALPALGMTLKKVQNVLAAREMDHLNALIRSNSPLARRLGGPLQDFAKRMQAFEVAPTPRNLAQISIASRNLSNNLKDAGIDVSPDALMQSVVAAPAAGEQKPGGEGKEQER